METNHEKSFWNIGQELSAFVKLARLKLEQIACFSTDAFESLWAAILTLIFEEDRERSVKGQRQEPLCFSLGAVIGLSKNRENPQKEMIKIEDIFCRLDYLIVEQSLSVCTDHLNIFYICDPMGATLKTPSHTANKLARWVVKLGAFDYVTEHVFRY